MSGPGSGALEVSPVDLYRTVAAPGRQVLLSMDIRGENGTGSPSEIHPQRGDTFTVLERWLDLDAQGKLVRRASQEGGTLTFGDSMFSWQELDAAPGQYILGFVVQVLDGNSYEQYATIEVESAAIRPQAYSTGEQWRGCPTRNLAA